MKFLTIISVFLFGLCSFSQSWASIGTTWYYSYSGSSYSVFESADDTLIDGMICRKIQKSKPYDYCFRPLIEYTYYSNDSVYFYDLNFSEFQLLYDFNANAGEYWYYRFPGFDFANDVDSIKIVVDSTDFVVINSFSLKRLYVHYEPENMEGDWMFDDYPSMNNSTIVEYIGDQKHFINTFALDGWQSEFPMFPLLRCFDDYSDIGHFETGVVDSCEWVNVLTVEENPDLNPEFSLFPNPVQDEINTTGIQSENAEISIYSSDGKEVFRQKLLGVSKVDVSHLTEGTYILELEYEGNVNRSQFLKL